MGNLDADADEKAVIGIPKRGMEVQLQPAQELFLRIAMYQERHRS
jgi:hypothetical protein